MIDRPIDPDVLDGIASVEQAYSRVRARIEDAEPSTHGYDAATELGARLDQLVSDARNLRGSELRRLRDARELSTAGVAALVGLSRPRASVLISATEPTD